ncbi:S49 family peptidase [Pseudomonas aestusnigri]|uniref:S49 family peptidase n=1 Tax=Halopseudomonas aestusnigri TaxID=857252 RepID=UPI001D196280|nr:S49 family peptidase [Halopseudomonas aestusnigri]MCC4261099.1 S49 family peptidase [Halopseudomonas aestusnigri]
MSYPQIASRVLNTPLLLEPGYARVFFSALAPRLNILKLQDADGEVSTGDKLRVNAASFTPNRDRERPYQLIDGAAILPVSGSLVHKYGHVKPYSGMTGYDGIIRRAADAFGDPAVKGVMLDCDTPGGEVAGCFDTVAELRRLADLAGKPLWSLCYDMTCSAGMALASSTNRRLITQTGQAGSVGVVMAHVSYEEYLKKEGMKVTLIHSGAQKVEGNPYQDLPEEVLSRFQTDTDALRQEFAQLVARYTGMSVEAVLATEAATYRGQAAIDIGFADQLVNGHEAVAEFTEYLSTQGRIITTGATMTQENLKPEASTAPPSTEQGQDDKANTNAERARVQGILQHAEAAERKQLAEHLAFNTDMSVEAAGAALAAAPKDASASLNADTALDRLMSSEEQPNLGEDAAAPTETQSKAQGIANSWAKATGAKIA